MQSLTHASGKVLIVDDDRDLRAVVSTMLKSVGFDVVDAEDGYVALEKAIDPSIDVVLLDLMMPGLDGFQVLERLNKTVNPPVVIVLSARGELDDRLHALFSGALTFLRKPYEPAELVAQVASAARQRARVRSAEVVSQRDALTGLRNRLAFDRALEAEISRSSRYKRPLALVYLDADGLKVINDTHGHSAGDDLIKSVARAVQSSCRASDHAARIGGDEFAVILAEADREQSGRFRERLSERLADESVRFGETVYTPSVSMGVAVFPEDATEATALREFADTDLYRHKREKKRQGGIIRA
jgi:two-component system, cell cycle response regulator